MNQKIKIEDKKILFIVNFLVNKKFEKTFLFKINNPKNFGLC